VKKKRWSHSLFSWFKGFDSSGTSVSLNIGGSEQYKTGLGAGFTLITRALLIFWLSMRVSKWYLKNDPDFISNEVISDLSKVKNVTFRDNNFNIAFGVFDLRKNDWTDIEPENGHL